MSLFGIQRSSSLLWLRRRTSCSSCSASVLVTGGSVSAVPLHQQLDLVTGLAAALAVGLLSICASVHRSPAPLGSLQDRHKSWNPSGSRRLEATGTCHTSRHLGEQLLALCRATSTSRTTAGVRPAVEVEVPRAVQRSGGLRYSRLHPDASSHSSRPLPVRSRLPHHHKSPARPEGETSSYSPGDPGSEGRRQDRRCRSHPAAPGRGLTGAFTWSRRSPPVAAARPALCSGGSPRD